ncbi:MAG: extracellular solute-binding protein [Chloroflexi bacterium]|nr:extracellular solute-binding protein [Chloroflexota bacterium]
MIGNRRISLLLPVIVLLFALSVPAFAQDGITLVVFGPSTWDTFAPGAGEEIVNQVTQELDAAFMAEHPEVTSIQHDARGTVADGLSRLMNAQLAGDQVDLIMCAANPVNTSYVSRGLLLPLDELVPVVQDRLIEGALEPFTLSDQVWGIPISGVSTTNFFYNKTLFDELGLAAPTTYDEILAAAAALDAAGVTPVLHQGKNPWMWPIWYMSTLAETTENQQLEKTISNLRGETSFTDAEDVAAMALVRKFVDDGILDPASLDLDEEGMRAAFISGQSGMYFGASWDFPILRTNVTEFELGVFRFPDFVDYPGAPQTYGGVEVGLCLSNTVSEANRQAALDYIEFASRPEYVSLTLGPLDPIATSHVDVVASDDPIAQQFRAEFLPTGKFLDWVWPRELSDTIQREIQRVVGGTATPEEAMQTIQDKFDEMVAQGYVYPF